jgi:hypothetical protein
MHGTADEAEEVLDYTLMTPPPLSRGPYPRQAPAGPSGPDGNGPSDNGPSDNSAPSPPSSGEPPEAIPPPPLAPQAALAPSGRDSK